MRLYLIGMMGAGKSTLGKKLASEINYEFIDMDNYIEKKCCMYISEIFEAYGEEWFREFERKTLVEFNSMDNVIIATGGGVIKNKANKELMDGKCIYLDVPAEILEERLKGTEEVRPLLRYKTPTEILNERLHLYEYFSDLTVLNVNIDDAIKTIKENL